MTHIGFSIIHVSQGSVATYRKTSIKRRVPNKRRVSIKRRGFEVSGQINAEGVY